jgi:membrane-bound ClpP family serine protease
MINALLLAIRSRQLKSRVSNASLYSASGVVTKALEPLGAVLISGELFFAESASGEIIPLASNVKVIGSNHHLLLVTPL